LIADSTQRGRVAHRAGRIDAAQAGLGQRALIVLLYVQRGRAPESRAGGQGRCLGPGLFTIKAGGARVALAVLASVVALDAGAVGPIGGRERVDNAVGALG
jgi:hypothetical protein